MVLATFQNCKEAPSVYCQSFAKEGMCVLYTLPHCCKVNKMSNLLFKGFGTWISFVLYYHRFVLV